MSSPPRHGDKDKWILELEAKVESLKEENAALLRKVEQYENFMRDNGLQFEPREVTREKRLRKIPSPEFQSSESSASLNSPVLTSSQEASKREKIRKVSRSFSRIPSLNTVNLSTPYEAKEKEKQLYSTKDLLNEPLFMKETTSPNDLCDFEKVGKLTILGERDLRKDVLHALSGHATEGNIESIIRVKVPGSQTLLNVWAFELDLHNTNSHQLFLSGTGIQVIACNISGHADAWKEETAKWLQLSKFHSRLFLPTLIVGYTDGRKRKKWNEKQMAAHFKKFKVSELIVIENPKSFEKNSRLIVDGVNNLIAKFPASLKKGPVFDKELMRSLVSMTDARVLHFAELVALIKMCARNANLKETLQQNVSGVYTVTDETAHEIILDSDLSSCISWLHDSGMVITFSEINFRDVVILDPSVFMSLLQAVKSLDLNSSIVPGSALTKIYASFLSESKVEMISKIMIYFEVISPYKGVKQSTGNVDSEVYWIVPSLLTSTCPHELIKEFRAFYLQENTKSNRLYQFETAPFSFFPRLYVLVVNCFSTRLQIEAWQSAKVCGILLSSSTEKILVQLGDDGKEVVLQFANSEEDYSLFCFFLNMVSQFFSTSFPTADFQESVQCTSCDIDNTPITEIFEMIKRDNIESITCPMTSQSVSLSSLCPDFYLPHRMLGPHVAQIEEKIGEGAYGLVQKGRLANGENVAVKTLRLDELRLDNKQKIFKFRELLREISILVDFDQLTFMLHPNIMQYLGGLLTPSLSLVMEYAPHGILADYIYDKNVRESNEKLKTAISINIAKGLQFLHELKPPIIHRDIRSYNIFMFNVEFLNEDTVYAKIGDFGLANRCVMNMWEILPTWQWLAPEIFNGEHYDERSDVYSFGMVLYEIFSGILPYTDQNAFIVKHSVKLTDEQLENQELMSQYETQGYCVDADSREAVFEEFKVQNMKSAILEGLRPTIPDNVNPSLQDLIKMCWRKRVPKRPVWARILQVLQTHLNSANHNKLFPEVRPFPVGISRVRKREPIQASFEMQLQKEKQKQNQEATTIQKRTPRADTNLSSGLTRPKIRKRRDKKFEQYDDLRQSARFNKEELEKMFSDEADAQRVPHTPKQIQDKIQEILEQDSKGRIKYTSKPNATMETVTTSATTSATTSEELPIATCDVLPIATCGTDAGVVIIVEAKKEEGEEARVQEKSEEVVEPSVQLGVSVEALASLPVSGKSEMCDDCEGGCATVGAVDVPIDDSKPAECEDAPQSVRIEEKPENVLVHPEAGEKEGQENRAKFRPSLDLIDSLTASDDMKDDKGSKSADDEEDCEREVVDARAREFTRDLIKLKVAKIDKTFSGMVNLVKQSDDFDFLQQLLKFASSMKKIFEFLDDILPPIEAYKIPGVIPNDKLTKIKSVLILNFVSFIQSLRFLVVEIDTTLKDDMDWIADISKVVKLCHRKTRYFLTEAKAL